MPPFQVFMDNYYHTGRLDATLLKLKVVPDQLPDMRQAVILHFLEKGFVEMYKENGVSANGKVTGSFSNHIYVGIRNFVIDQFRATFRQVRTISIISKSEGEEQAPGTILEDHLEYDPLEHTPLCTEARVTLDLESMEKMLAIDEPWRETHWTLAYYRTISDFVRRSTEHPLSARCREEAIKAAQDLQALEKEKFSHLLIFKLSKLGYSIREISEFVGISESRTGGLLKEAHQYLSGRVYSKVYRRNRCSATPASSLAS